MDYQEERKSRIEIKLSKRCIKDNEIIEIPEKKQYECIVNIYNAIEKVVTNKLFNEDLDDFETFKQKVIENYDGCMYDEKIMFNVFYWTCIEWHTGYLTFRRIPFLKRLHCTKKQIVDGLESGLFDE